MSSKTVRWIARNEKYAAENGTRNSVVAKGESPCSGAASGALLLADVLKSLSGFCLDSDLEIEISTDNSRFTIRF